MCRLGILKPSAMKQRQGRKRSIAVENHRLRSRGQSFHFCRYKCGTKVYGQKRVCLGCKKKNSKAYAHRHYLENYDAMMKANRDNWEIIVLRSCVECGVLYIPGRDRYCSRACILKHKRDYENEVNRKRKEAKQAKKPKPIPSDYRELILTDIAYKYRKRAYKVISKQGKIF